MSGGTGQCICTSHTAAFLCDTSLFGGGISVKLATNIHHGSGAVLKSFSRSEVKGQGYSETKCTFAAEACISVVGDGGSLVLQLK